MGRDQLCQVQNQGTFFSGGDGDRRKGMNGKPMFKYLDSSDVLTLTHAWICGFKCFWRLFTNINARDDFPKRQITMRGQYKGQEVNDAIEIARLELVNEAKKEPIKMLVDSPDPHGEFHLFTILSAVCLHLIHFN